MERPETGFLLLRRGHNDPDAAAGGTAKIVVPALQRIVAGVDLRQGRQIVAAASVGVPQEDLYILGNIIAAVAR